MGREDSLQILFGLLVSESQSLILHTVHKFSRFPRRSSHVNNMCEKGAIWEKIIPMSLAGRQVVIEATFKAKIAGWLFFKAWTAGWRGPNKFKAHLVTFQPTILPVFSSILEIFFCVINLLWLTFPVVFFLLLPVLIYVSRWLRLDPFSSSVIWTSVTVREGYLNRPLN